MWRIVTIHLQASAHMFIMRLLANSQHIRFTGYLCPNANAVNARFSHVVGFERIVLPHSLFKTQQNSSNFAISCSYIKVYYLHCTYVIKRIYTCMCLFIIHYTGRQESCAVRFCRQRFAELRIYAKETIIYKMLGKCTVLYLN